MLNRLIYEYDWDPKTGDLCKYNRSYHFISPLKIFLFYLIGNGRAVFTFNFSGNLSLFIVGLTLDRDNYLYTAIYGGSKILKIDLRFAINSRTSSVEQEIEMPVPIVTSPMFGGPNLDEIFVTSGKLSVNVLLGEPEPNQPNNPLEIGRGKKAIV